jgi:hypothetical protein
MNEVVKNILLPLKYLLPYRHAQGRGKNPQSCVEHQNGTLQDTALLHDFAPDVLMLADRGKA